MCLPPGRPTAAARGRLRGAGLGGAVFSVGSINWLSSLASNRVDNNVARVTDNVLRRFVNPRPCELPPGIKPGTSGRAV